MKIDPQQLNTMIAALRVFQHCREQNILVHGQPIEKMDHFDHPDLGPLDSASIDQLCEYLSLGEAVGPPHNEYIVLPKEEETEGDDMCDKCMRSGVEVARTDENGDTICTECDKDSPDNDKACDQCGERFSTTEQGINNHIAKDGGIDHNADADHVPFHVEQEFHQEFQQVPPSIHAWQVGERAIWKEPTRHKPYHGPVTITSLEVDGRKDRIAFTLKDGTEWGGWVSDLSPIPKTK